VYFIDVHVYGRATLPNQLKFCTPEPSLGGFDVAHGHVGSVLPAAYFGPSQGLDRTFDGFKAERLTEPMQDD
jgi:hypothetical protein